MARSRKVEAATGVNSAMSLFWRDGFHNSGTRQIEEETGITRFLLQTTYGGKMKLFLTALDAYLDYFENMALLGQPNDDLESIAVFFETRGNADLMPKAACHGCFMLNSMIEFSRNNTEINQRADRYFDMLRAGFRAALRRSQDDGTLGAVFDIEQKIEVLLSSALGLNVAIRANDNPEAGAHMAASIAALIREWGQAKELD